MSFRKRNVSIARPEGSPGSTTSLEKVPISGVRPSPVDGRPTMSTGTRSLDSLLAGHSGLVLGCSLLIEEVGTTDFGGALLRYFAAEGVIQGHHIHLLGVSDTWARDLPALSTEGKILSKNEGNVPLEDKMKIAWRYERLGEFGAGARGGHSISFHKSIEKPELYLLFPPSTDYLFRQKFITVFKCIIQCAHPSSILS